MGNISQSLSSKSLKLYEIVRSFEKSEQHLTNSFKTEMLPFAQERKQDKHARDRHGRGGRGQRDLRGHPRPGRAGRPRGDAGGPDRPLTRGRNESRSELASADFVLPDFVKFLHISKFNFPLDFFFRIR